MMASAWDGWRAAMRACAKACGSVDPMGDGKALLAVGRRASCLAWKAHWLVGRMVVWMVMMLEVLWAALRAGSSDVLELR